MGNRDAGWQCYDRHRNGKSFSNNGRSTSTCTIWMPRRQHPFLRAVWLRSMPPEVGWSMAERDGTKLVVKLRVYDRTNAMKTSMAIPHSVRSSKRRVMVMWVRQALVSRWRLVPMIHRAEGCSDDSVTSVMREHVVHLQCCCGFKANVANNNNMGSGFSLRYMTIADVLEDCSRRCEIISYNIGSWGLSEAELNSPGMRHESSWEGFQF